MLGILLLIVGLVGASSGLMLWGIAGTIVGGHDTMFTIGVWSMIVGVIMSGIGSVLYRANEKKLEAAYNK